MKEGVEWQEGKGRWERMEVGKGRKREKETRENEGKRVRGWGCNSQGESVRDSVTRCRNVKEHNFSKSCPKMKSQQFFTF